MLSRSLLPGRSGRAEVEVVEPMHALRHWLRRRLARRLAVAMRDALVPLP